MQFTVDPQTVAADIPSTDSPLPPDTQSPSPPDAVEVDEPVYINAEKHLTPQLEDKPPRRILRGMRK